MPKYYDYLDCMVAFIDILGFDSRIRKISSEQDFNDIGMLLYAVKETERAYNDNQDLFKSLSVTAISDSIIMTMPYKDPICAMAMITIIKKFQYDLISTNFETLIRGYLTRGHVYHKNGIIFGKGYSEAYRKEREVGHAPRIVVDPHIIENGKQKVKNYKGKEKIDHIFNYLMKDVSDGYYFIDYLRPFRALPNDIELKILEERRIIKTFINRCKVEYKDDEKILRKYEWLINYYSITEQYF